MIDHLGIRPPFHYVAIAVEPIEDQRLGSQAGLHADDRIGFSRLSDLFFIPEHAPQGAAFEPIQGGPFGKVSGQIALQIRNRALIHGQRLGRVRRLGSETVAKSLELGDIEVQPAQRAKFETLHILRRVLKHGHGVDRIALVQKELGIHRKRAFLNRNRGGIAVIPLRHAYFLPLLISDSIVHLQTKRGDRQGTLQRTRIEPDQPYRKAPDHVDDDHHSPFLHRPVGGIDAVKRIHRVVVDKRFQQVALLALVELFLVDGGRI